MDSRGRQVSTVVKNMGSGDRLPGFRSKICQLLAGKFLTPHASVSPIYKVGWVGTELVVMCKMLKTVPGWLLALHKCELL